MTSEARRGERRFSCGSMHWHHVPSKPKHSFTSHKSWMPWDWRSPLNQASLHTNPPHPIVLHTATSSMTSHHNSPGPTLLHSERPLIQVTHKVPTLDVLAKLRGIIKVHQSSQVKTPPNQYEPCPLSQCAPLQIIMILISWLRISI